MKGELFKEQLKHTANLALLISGNKIDYTDEELSDAILVLTEVLLSKTYDHHAPHLSQKEVLELAEECGKSIRQTVLLFTGVDLHIIYERNV